MKRVTKQLLALMAAVMLLVSAVPMVSADELPTLSLGTLEVTVPTGDYVVFAFTAPETGTYTFSSMSNTDPHISLCDAEGRTLVRNDDGGEGAQFHLAYAFEKDETVTVHIATYSGNDQVVSVTVQKAPEPTDIDIAYGIEEVSLALFEEGVIDVVLTPEGANPFAITVSSSNEKVVEVSQNAEDLLIYAVGVGTATITVAISDTASKTITVTVRPPLEWDITKEQPVWLTSDCTAHTFRFTAAQEGYYTFMISGDGNNVMPLILKEADTPDDYDSVDVIDADGNYGGLWGTLYLKKDATYYVHVRGYLWGGRHTVESVMTLEPSDYEPLEEGVRFEQDSATVASGEFFEPFYQLGDDEDEDEVEITTEDEAILLPADDGFVGQKPGEVTLTITTASGASDTMTVTVVPTPVLELGKRTEVVFGGQHERVFAFTPEEDGVYVFRSYDTVGDPYVDLYDHNWNTIDNADDSSVDYNFCLEVELEGGETYYLVCSSYEGDPPSYEVDVQKGVDATSVTLGLSRGVIKQDGKTYYTYVGSYLYPSITFGDAAGALEEDYAIEVGDETIVDDGDVLKVGETTITITTDSGLTDTITVVAVEKVTGDLNVDGELTKDDLTVLQAYLNGKADLSIPLPFADLNKDCAVNANDAAVLREWLGIAVETGDVNADGKINTTDARVVLQYAAGIIKEDALTLDAADTNADGKVNTTDARRILQFAAGIITSF